MYFSTKKTLTEKIIKLSQKINVKTYHLGFTDLI